MSEFGDLEDDDAYAEDEDQSEIDWDQVALLQEVVDEISMIEDDWDRKVAAKALVRKLNGEDDG